MHTTNLDTYFRHTWRPNTDKYKHSGWALLDKVKPNQRVLDAGCGYNQFKPFFGGRLFGIDPYNSAADLEVSIEDYNTPFRYDVIFCLGSINFGPEEIILKQVEKIVALCEPGGMIYWRQNPGQQDHGNEECKGIVFFDWSFAKNIEYADRFGCKIMTLVMDGNRIYAEWQKK